MNYKKLLRDVVVRLLLLVVIAVVFRVIGTVVTTYIENPTATQLALDSVNGNAQNAQAFHSLRQLANGLETACTLIAAVIIFAPLFRRDYKN